MRSVGRKSQGHLRSIKEQLKTICKCSVLTALLDSNYWKRQGSWSSACLPVSVFPVALGLAFDDDDELMYFYEMSGKSF